MVGILDPKFCIDAKSWKGEYEASRVYLGISRVLPSSVAVTLKIEFRNQAEEEEFFVFWKETTVHGAKPFYVHTSLYGVRTHYLVQIDGSLDHTKRPLAVSGKFELYTARTLEENIPPVIETQSFDVDMDSTNNYIYVVAGDIDLLTYSIAVAPSNGVIADMGGGAFYYTPTDGFSGTDTFTVKVTDEVGATAEAVMSVNVVNWQSALAFKWGLDDELQSFIEYSNNTLLSQAVKDDLATLANAVMIYDLNGLPQIDYSACTGIVNISFDNNGHMIVETVN
jgi:hypothetical protein